MEITAFNKAPQSITISLRRPPVAERSFQRPNEDHVVSRWRFRIRAPGGRTIEVSFPLGYFSFGQAKEK